MITKANRWGQVDARCWLGPNGERVMRWHVETEQEEGWYWEWRYRAWYRGDQGPVRDRLYLAFEDAERLANVPRETSAGGQSG